MVVVMTENALLTLDEVAAQLRVKPKTVKKYIVLGQIEAIIVGNRYRVRQEALDRYLARNTRPETEQK